MQTIKIVRDKKTKLCKGYAFLEVANRDGAALAVAELDGRSLAGRALKLSIVEPDQINGKSEPLKSKRPRRLRY